jgi:hypothetical protein
MFFKTGIAGLVYRIEGDSREPSREAREAPLDAADGAILEWRRVADADIETGCCCLPF